MWTSCNAMSVSAVNPPGVHAAASDVSGACAAAMESSAAPEAATATAASREGVIWSETYGRQDRRDQANQTVPNHVDPPEAGVPGAFDDLRCAGAPTSAPSEHSTSAGIRA
jgi:hypothetical protein